MDESSSAKKTSGIRWYHLVVAGLFILVAAVVIWWNDDSDLRRVATRATSMGIATTWEDAHVVASTSERIAAWNHAVDMIAYLPRYQNSNPDDDKPDHPRYVPYQPVPAQMVAHHQHLPADKVTQFFRDLQIVGGDPLIMRTSLDLSTACPEIMHGKKIMQFLVERMAIDEHPEEFALTLINWSNAPTCQSLVLYLVKNATTAMAANAIAQRMVDIPKPCPSLADRLDTLAAQCDKELRDALENEFRIMLSLFKNSALLSSSSYSSGVDATTVWSMQLTRRAFREGVLNNLLEVSSDLAAPNANWLNLHKKFEELAQDTPLNHLMKKASLRTVMDMNAAFDIVLDLHNRRKMRLHLLAAELRQTPWPVDTFDPAGKSLRRLERDGKLIGAYTVYKDGIDDGGDTRSDRVFELYGPATLPTPKPSPVTPATPTSPAVQ